ncbi:hypothetical protein [Micromonospora sp. WMMD710]|uniref:hypothetical protein n=1 Tax=unclassified Micromonospora TaxID=2617518 RepID=UPI002417099A|nr:hypothetical protein [Micromonospora sp. WMMD710]MDG4760194.1 hypothetical protein [Micromonospora sp. WMMD710]
MTANPLRAVPVDVAARQPELDYYVVLPRRAGAAPTGQPEGILVEEFSRAHDFSTTGLNSAGWTREAGWWSSAALSRSVRTDPDTLARVVPSSRHEAEVICRMLGGGDLPAESVLRTYFREHLDLASAPPLRLGPAQPPDGFHERRVYRVLFARQLGADQVASLRMLWRATDVGTGSLASGQLDEGGDRFTWDVRPVGHGRAWCLDVTVLMRSSAAQAVVSSTLSDLTNILRQHGLVPVTTERFA